jgi:hypothetical protein
VNPEALLEKLRAYETELHRPEVRCDAEVLGRLLHPQFREFGRSGRIYERSEVLAEFAVAPSEFEILAQDFKVLSLSDSSALLTYRSAHVRPGGQLDRHTNRASVWRLTDVGWQLIFHQGTPTEGFERNAT